MNNKMKWKEAGIDLIVDIAASMLIAVGIYNFALTANFPVAGFSGIAIILYHLFGLPVGAGTLLLNVPVAIFCYKFLGRTFFLKSVKTMVISSVFMDYIAPLFPVYEGNRLLAALCMGVLSGAGYAIVFMRGSSTGGQDFISMAIKKVKPHISLGIITFALDTSTIILGSLLVFKDIDGFIYGIIVTYLMAIVMDRILYGVDEGKMTLIVTEPEVTRRSTKTLSCAPATISRCIPSRRWYARLTPRHLRLLWSLMRSWEKDSKKTYHRICKKKPAVLLV